MKQITQTINEMLENPILTEMTYKYRNSIELSGWVIRKPRFIKHDITGVESCSLSLYQLNNVRGKLKIESFCLMVYVKDLIQQLKEQKNILFIATMGKVRHHLNHGDYTQVTEIETIAELDMPFVEE